MSDTWEYLFDAAVNLNRFRTTPKPIGHDGATAQSSSSNGAMRPGDDFNARASWNEILEPHGWRAVREYSGKIYWRRPGKDQGYSATTGHCRSESRGDLLYVFTTSANGLNGDKSYSKFEAFAALNHAGDFSAAARDLAERGFGEQNQTYSFRRAGQQQSEPTPEAPPEVPILSPDDVATIDDLIRAGSQVQWTWEGWIPSGVLTAIAAKAGAGKTRFCADLVRRIRHGLPWPDGSPMTLPQDSIALWVVADNHHDEMVTLAQAFGIVDNIRINAPKSDPYSGVSLESPVDYADLEGRIKAVQPRLVIVDTVGNATDKNLSRQEDAKAFYWPLQIIARKHRTSILCLTHLNATGHFLGRRVLEKVRVALRIEQPDENNDRRRLEVSKSNSKRPPALGVTMGDGGNEYDNQPPMNLDDQIGTSPQKGGKRIDECADWLRDILITGPKRVSNTRTEAEDAGFSSKTLYAAVARAGVQEDVIEGLKWWRLAPESPFEN